MIVAVDGASGTGKSTICKLLASEFGFIYVDTGAIYRCVALAAKNANISLDNEKGLKDLCSNLKLSFVFRNGVNSVILDSHDVTGEIRTPQMAMMASAVSAIPVVRASLLEMQKRLVRNATFGAIVDGRDMGTIVFPEAEIKIFLTASDEVRARRRYNELKSRNIEVNFEQVLKETIQRDRQDSERTIAPLRKAPDAVEINTDGLSIEEEKEKLAVLIRNYMP
jgi:cytidylate kinase